MSNNHFKLEPKNDFFMKGDLDEMARFRFKNGRCLPHSYQCFVQQYGYGLSCDEFLIYLPMGKNCDSLVSRSQAVISTYSDILDNENDVWFDLIPDASFDKLKHLYPFSMSEKGNYLFWDITSGENEMDIYITDFRGLGFIHAAQSLYQFFDRVTSPDQYKLVFPKFYQAPLPATFVGFEPDSLTCRV